MAIKVGKERELRLSRKERKHRQELYRIDDYELLEAAFPEAPERRLYKNFNFSIFIDDRCNAKCPFCVAELRYETRDLYYQKKKLLPDDQEYFSRLREVLELIRPFDPSVSVTGGEPTISRRFPQVAKLLAEYDFRKKVVTSNGSGIFRRLGGGLQSNAELLVECGFDHLNISRAALDETVNQELMKYKGKSRTSYEDIAKIVEFFKGEKPSLRLSCVLTKGGVSDLSTLKNYVQGFNKIGVDNFIFRELMGSDEGSVNTEIIEWCDANRVPLEGIWEEFDQDPSFDPVASILGYYYYVEVWKHQGATITTEAAHLQQQYKEKDANPDVIYETVFHENGNLTASWVEDEDVLSLYTRS